MHKKMWFQLYGVLASALDKFYMEHKDKSGKALYQLCFAKKAFLDINPWTKNIEATKSLDPLQIFASFNNYKIPTAKRKAKIHLYLEALGIDHLLDDYDLDVFLFLPHPNITHLVANRKEESQKEIWEFLHALVHNDLFTIERYYDHNNWYGIQTPALSIFMFWVDSTHFVPLDKITVAILSASGTLEVFPKNFKIYRELLKKAKGLHPNTIRNLAHYGYDNYAIDTMSQKEKMDLLAYINGGMLDRDEIDLEMEKAVNDSLGLEDEDRLARINRAKKVPDRIVVTSRGFRRNPDVVAHVLKRANGICENCRQPAPFKKKKDDSPFLEIHHRKFLSKGGEDTIENAQALCPNCHREKHFG